MKVLKTSKKGNKKNTAIVYLESSDEVEAFASMVEHYMNNVWEEAEKEDDSYNADRIAESLDKKFNK